MAGKVLKNSFSENFPLIELFINWQLKLFPLPGLPIIIKGIFVQIDTKSKNRFSLKELL